MSRKPKLGVFKFASCDGCQLSMLDAEEHLLGIAGQVDIAYFLEARSHIDAGPYDVALVEGSVTTAHDAERIQEIRRKSKTLITIGACATAGGIQALRNWHDVDDFIRYVYAHPDYIQTLKTSTPIADHVQVDFELRGCPISVEQLVELITSVVLGRKPRFPNESVCMECKRQGTVCVVVAQGTPCLGPVTHSGCGSICPAHNRGCYGCFGPKENAQPLGLLRDYQSHGCDQRQLVDLVRNFNGYSPEFREAVEQFETSISSDNA
ncbi:MAG: oxidoreductase [Planctomycetaceae bacterium]|nr:oxidoreductase [Planctomycetaceae bacterium]